MYLYGKNQILMQYYKWGENLEYRKILYGNEKINILDLGTSVIGKAGE